MISSYVDIALEVKEALDNGKPIIAIETGGTFEGLPYPDCVTTANQVCEKVRAMGVVPAYIAVVKGKIKVGMTPDEIDEFGQHKAGAAKVSVRELPTLLAQGRDGIMTIAATMMIADLLSIPVVAGCGIGGVHRGVEDTMDISADLEEIAVRNVVVVCSGAKAILDLARTMEYLETKSIPVIGYGTDELPAYMARTSGIKLPCRMDTVEEVAKSYRIKNELGINQGMLLMNPISEEYAVDADEMNAAIDAAVRLSVEQGVTGKPLTKFIMTEVKNRMGDDSEGAHKQLILQDAILAAELARQI